MMLAYTDKICKLPTGGIWLVFVLGMLACLMAAAGCDNQQEMVDPKASLEKVAAEYWNKRLIDKDYKTTYEMEREKGSLPFKEYTQRVYNAGAIEYLSLKIKEAKIDKDKGVVALIIKCKIAPFDKSTETSMSDEWVIESNRWKHVLPKKRAALPNFS